MIFIISRSCNCSDSSLNWISGISFDVFSDSESFAFVLQRMMHRVNIAASYAKVISLPCLSPGGAIVVQIKIKAEVMKLQ